MLEQIAKELKDGTIDAAFIVNLQVPKRIEDLIKNNKAYCLKISKSDLTQIASAHSKLYTLLSVIDPKNINKRFMTISVTSVLITKAKTDKDVVRSFTKLLCDKYLYRIDYFKNYE